MAVKEGNGVSHEFKVKKGSVFPARRKLVKRMMFDQIFSSSLSPYSGKSSQLSSLPPLISLELPSPRLDTPSLPQSLSLKMAEKNGNGVAQKFKAKEGSIFPARRKLVKRLMWDQIRSSFLSLFTHKTNNQQKKNKVFPD